MVDNYNLVRPVELTPSIGGVTPASKRKEKRNKPDAQQQKEEKDKQALDELIENEADIENITETLDQNGSGIDYCA